MTLVDDAVYEVDAQLITVKEGDVDIGANPSAEGGDEDFGEESGEQIINIVRSFNLQSIPAYDKKAYLSELKKYFKRLSGVLEAEEFNDFKSKATAYATKVAKNIKDYDFYIAEDLNPDGMIVLCNYREDGVTPYFVFWKAGLKGQKV